MWEELKQMIKDTIRMKKEDFRRFLGKEKKKDPNTLSEAEQWLEGELEHQRRVKRGMTFSCFGLHYPERYLRTHTAEEAYAQYNKDVDSLLQFVDDCLWELKQKERKELPTKRKIVPFRKK